MTLSTLDRQALHVLFSFAQADRLVDVRLAARLLMCSQRDLRCCLARLEVAGLVEAHGSLSALGMMEAARLRRPDRGEVAAAA